MKMKIFMLAVCATIFFTSVSAVSGLEPGDNAPELLVEKWMKGLPVKISDGKDKNIFVIEFWATWCQPCMVSIPHLSELQKEYADKGVIIAGISTEKENVIAEFLKKQENIDYSVGLDNKGKTYSEYMGSEAGIPMCFLIGKQGKLLWKGHPMDIGRVLKLAIAGNLDIERQKKISKLHEKLQAVLNKQEMAAIFKISEEILDEDPSDELAISTLLFTNESNNELDKSLELISRLQKKAPDDPKLYFYKLDLLNQAGAAAKDKQEECEKVLKQFGNDGEVLNSLSWMMMDRFKFGTFSMRIALDAAEKAMKLLPAEAKPVKKSYFHATLARAYYNIGKLDLAVQEQEKAVDFAKGVEPDSRSAIEFLEYYKDALKLNKSKSE